MVSAPGGPDEQASSAILFLEHQNLRQPDSAPSGQATPSKGRQKDGTRAEFLGTNSCSLDRKVGGVGMEGSIVASTSENLDAVPA
jgi:hypothetical protein